MEADSTDSAAEDFAVAAGALGFMGRTVTPSAMTIIMMVTK
jgi:hypothetical protein